MVMSKIDFSSIETYGVSEEVLKETVDLLSKIIQHDTSNPPGNESKLAWFLKDYLEKNDVEAEVIESAENRGNLLATIKGKGNGKRLMLLSHLDVVPAKKEDWSVDPFGGITKDNQVWGRGAVDCKSLLTVELMGLLTALRDGHVPKGDILLLSVADEEVGGTFGAGWLVKNRPDVTKVDYVINEGGGVSLKDAKSTTFLMQTSEKAVAWIKLKVKGVPAHASVPDAGDNAIIKMSKIIDRISNYDHEITILPDVKEMLTSIPMPAFSRFFLKNILFKNKFLLRRYIKSGVKKKNKTALSLKAMISMTMAPTIINGGYKTNIIPDECELSIDCRVLPTQDDTDVERVLKEITKDIDGVSWEIRKDIWNSRSEFHTPFKELIENTIKEIIPNSKLAPLLLMGATDSRYFRQKGIIAYGFQPIAHFNLDDTFALAHGIDERVHVSDLALGVQFFNKLIKKW